MRRRYVALTSLRRHVSAGNLPSPLPPRPPQYLNLGSISILNLPTPIFQSSIVGTVHEYLVIYYPAHIRVKNVIAYYTCITLIQDVDGWVFAILRPFQLYFKHIRTMGG